MKLAFVVVLLALADPGVAYEPGTHAEIARQAVQPDVSRVDEVLKAELSLPRGILEALTGSPVERLIADGGYLEDVPGVRSFNHFHDPLVTPWDEAGLSSLLASGQSSILWQQNAGQDETIVRVLGAPVQAGGGRWSWQDARRLYLDALAGRVTSQRDNSIPAGRERSLGEVFLGLGRLTHLVQDATVPAHVRNDPHPHFLPYQADGYERWLERIRIGARPTFDALLQRPPVKPPASIFTLTNSASAPLPFARLIDTDRFTGTEFSVLRDTALGVAEYTGGNFVSRGTMFAPHVLPRVSSLEPTAFFELEGGGARFYFSKIGEGESVIRHFVAEGLLHTTLRDFVTVPPAGGWTLTDRVHQDYAERLIPRAVGFSAALLDYFFRGTLELAFEPDPGDAARSRLVAVNRSEEPLGPQATDPAGTLSLHIDDAQGTRTQVAAVAVAAPVPGGGELPPLAGLDPLLEVSPLTAVYRGRLGGEPEAVVAKVQGPAEVEQLVRGASDWLLRTADGVFPLGLGLEPAVVKWGDADNTLVAQSFPGGSERRFTAYRINRPEGSRTVPVRADGTVDLVPAGPPVELGGPAPIDLGTTVAFTRIVDYAQQLLTIEGDYFSHFDESQAIWVLDRREFTPGSDAIVHQEQIQRGGTFALAMPLSLPSDTRYFWSLVDFHLDRRGDVIALVRVDLTGPPGLVLPVHRHDASGTIGPSTAPFDSVFVDLSPPVTDVFFFVVNVTRRTVIGKSCEDSVNITYRTVQREAFMDLHITFHGPGGESWTPVSILDLAGQEPVVGGLRTDRGPAQVTASGLYRGELRAVGFAEPGTVSETFPATTVRLRDPFAPVTQPRPLEAAVTLTQSVRNLAPGLMLPYDVRRANGPEEGYALLGWGGEAGVETWTPMQWFPGRSAVSVMGTVGTPAPSDASLADVSRRTAWVNAIVFVPRERSTYFFTDRGAQIVMPGDLRAQYRLLEPDQLYGVGDQRFHRIMPELPAIPAPRPLASGPGTTGDYHVVGRR